MRPASMLPLLLVFLLLFHDRAHADCERATCGNLTSSSPCGHPAFQVWCSDDGSGFASLNGSAIHVLGIDCAKNSFIASHTRLTTGDDGVCRVDFNYSEVINITCSLNNKLGEGGYGKVFKGRLYDGRLVAVKLLHECKGNREEFVNEVMSIGRTSHVNIVNLFGFCLERSKRALIYEYMPNDKDFCPKIADFGLAKLCHTKESRFSMTGARGTIGFIAPEVHSRTFGVVSTKSDVYSYGMMLLEMVGGRKNVKSIVQKSSEKYFPHWIYDHFAQDDGLQFMTLIGLWCIQILPMHRPTITKVLEMFERDLHKLDMPPKQNFSQILEDPVYNLDTESMSPNSSAETQGSSEDLKAEEIKHLN
ncbi:hypothetical protein BDA96_03G083300 [Sorghum bicolor]|uniref:Protein kinase domain-containing protein n=1 Tax=Sorghum bicolor TaxID=4558 RepID=A0A921UP54_SORBI|nr:hypothetical protein BDA96_03G083300 [Sorghum bicolor]